MAGIGKCVRFMAILILVLSLIVGISVNILADPGPNDPGSFDIFTLKNGNWQWQGKFSFNNYETRELVLEHAAGLFKLRLVQQGHDAAYVDYVALCKDGVAYHPVSAVNVDGNTNVLAKIMSPEYDVCASWGSTLEMVWDSLPANTTLVMRAMEEDLGKDHGGPLYYPYIHLGQTLKYTLVNDGGITVDSLLAESKQPDFSVFWTPTSPHPTGYTYGWLHSDEDYLYAAVEVTVDNTRDEEDWGALYLKVNGGLKEFRVSPQDARWGAIGFQYTPSVPYEHRIYEFKIPLNEIGARTGDELQYGFGCYGTAEITLHIEIDTIPANTGSVTFEVSTYNDGAILASSAGNHPIEAHPGTGYVFSAWQVVGGINVTDPTLANTTINVSDNGTLIMVQKPMPPLPILMWSSPADDDVTDIAIGDLNGDLKEDVAAIDTPPTDATLHVIRGEGSPYWNKPLDGYAVAVGDITGNGTREVIAAAVPGIHAYNNAGFLEIWNYTTYAEVTDIEIGNIDGIGKDDVVACDRYGGLYVLNGSGGNLPGWPKNREDTGYEYFMDVAVGQLDGTGGMDVAAIGSGPVDTLFVFSSTGGDMWSKPIAGRTVEIGDVNGDSLNEVVAGTDDGFVYAYKGTDGSPLFSFQCSNPVKDIALGDLDGNTANGVEIAWISSNALTPTTIYALDIDNSPGSQIMWTYPISWDTDYYGESLAIGDVDRDYKNEVVACSSLIAHGIYAFDGLDRNGDGIGDLVWSPYMMLGDPGLKITDLKIGDLDGDGDKDVVIGTTRFYSPISDSWSSLIVALANDESKTPTSTNTGTAYFDSDPSTLEDLQPVSEGTLLPSAGKPNYDYPHGFFSFKITGLDPDLDPGQTALVTVTLPSNAPIGTQWVKFQNGQWFTLPIGDDDGDNIITFQVTDGGQGDADGTKNGTIVEPGGPGYPRPTAVGGEVPPVNRLAVITPWLVLVFAVIIGGTILVLRRRKGREG